MEFVPPHFDAKQFQNCKTSSPMRQLGSACRGAAFSVVKVKPQSNRVLEPLRPPPEYEPRPRRGRWPLLQKWHQHFTSRARGEPSTLIPS